MSQYHEQFRTFTAGGTIAQYRFVKLDPADATKVLACTTADDTSIIGVSWNSVVSGDLVNVHLRSRGNTSKVACASGFSGTFSSAINLYAGLSGYASEGNPSAGTAQALALEDSANVADGGAIVEILWKS